MTSPTALFDFFIFVFFCCCCCCCCFYYTYSYFSLYSLSVLSVLSILSILSAPSPLSHSLSLLTAICIRYTPNSALAAYDDSDAPVRGSTQLDVAGMLECSTVRRESDPCQSTQGTAAEGRHCGVATPPPPPMMMSSSGYNVFLRQKHTV